MRALVAVVALAACDAALEPMPDAGISDDDDDPAQAAVFRNPLNPSADPFLTYHAGSYFLMTTQGDALRMWTAPSLAELAVAPPTTIWQDTDPTRNRDIWAPSFYRFDGRWYVYYTADDGIDDHHRLHVLESAGDDPLGPYHYKAKLEPFNGTNLWAIDPEVFEQNGVRYLVWSGETSTARNRLFIAPLANPWTIGGPRVYLPAAGGCPEVREAPSVVQHDGTTHLVYSTCDTGKPDYQLWSLRIPMTADPMIASSWTQVPAPWLAAAPEVGVYGPGSNAFFRSPDGTEDWIVYHAKNTATFTYDGRTTRAQKIDWNGGLVPVSVNAALPLPSGDPGPGTRTLDDADAAFTGDWTLYPGCGQCMDGADHGSTQTGATATYTFSGTQIAVYAVRDAGNGIAAFSIDGAAETMRDTYAAIRQGTQPIYVSPKVAPGTHTLSIRVTGTKSAASSGVAIGIDRADIFGYR